MAEQSDKNLSREEAQELTERLAEVAGSGLPLADGLWAASCEIPRRRVRRSLRQLAEFVRRGGTLDQAIETGRLPLPAHLAGWLKAGARSGHLVQVLTELTDYYRRSRDVWRQLWLALSYPVMLLGLLAVIVVVVIALVVPDVAALYRDTGNRVTEDDAEYAVGFPHRLEVFRGVHPGFDRVGRLDTTGGWCPELDAVLVEHSGIGTIDPLGGL